MKKILITGVNSYVGNSLADWLSKEPENYSIDKISMRDVTWKEKDFSIYDVVVHVAGVAHQKETKKNAKLYYDINRDLANEIATKAKNDGVQYFIFLSSMSVYGIDKGIIGEDTIPKPTNHYGRSKLQAEKSIQKLSDNSFKVAIVRPPMIYGKGCKGNYQRLSKLAIKTPVFPDVNNKRSMIFIDNLSEFLRKLVDCYSSGIFFPQNKEFVNTSQMVQVISKQYGKDIKMTKLFNPLLRILRINTINKVFGDLVYEKRLSEYKYNYDTINFINSIEASEKGNKNE